MATKVSITSYIEGLLGETSITVPDQTIMAGMEDILRKLETYLQQALADFWVETAVVSNPVTLQNPLGAIELYCGNDRAIRRSSKQHAANKMSLMYDRGDTAYYYIVGSKLYIEPYVPARNTYTVRGIAYAVSNGSITWPDKYIYPLALFAACDYLYSRYSRELESIASDVTTFPSLTLAFTNAETRLSNDDVELASAELAKLRTQIDAYAAGTQIEGARVQRIQMRVELAQQLLSRYMAMKARYQEYFGFTQEGEK